MDDLRARTPFGDMLPVQVGGLRLFAPPVGVMTSITPYRGASGPLARSIRQAHGLELPQSQRMSGQDATWLIWFALGQYLLIGPPPHRALADHAAITDQSDAWAVAQLEGTGAALALAHLTPLDLRIGAFPVGAVARSQIQHMHGAVARVAEDGFILMVFRSMAGSFVHDLRQGMEAAHARR